MMRAYSGTAVEPLSVKCFQLDAFVLQVLSTQTGEHVVQR